MLFGPSFVSSEGGFITSFLVLFLLICFSPRFALFLTSILIYPTPAISMSSVINTQHSSLQSLEGDQDEAHLIPFFPPYGTSSFQYPIPYHPSDIGGVYRDQHDHLLPQEANNHQCFSSDDGSRDPLLLRMSIPNDNDENKGDKKTKRSAGDNSRSNETARWMSSKMRLMRKMMNSYPHHQVRESGGEHGSDINNSSNATVRVCCDCNTTKTPLWRSGPQGPKSLCNACGIRQRKARKAMAAAAMAGDMCAKFKRLDASNISVIPYKKRYKMEQTGTKTVPEDFRLTLNQKSSFHPQEEKEAAILLMALSCDLIYG